MPISWRLAAFCVVAVMASCGEAPEPTLEEIDSFVWELNRTDLTVTVSEARVLATGDSTEVAFFVENLGPNSTDDARLTVVSADGSVRMSGTRCVGSDTQIVCELGGIDRPTAIGGEPVRKVSLTLSFGQVPPEGTELVATVENAAGPDPVPENNTVSLLVHTSG